MGGAESGRRSAPPAEDVLQGFAGPGRGGFLGVMAFSNAFTCLMNLHRLLDTAGLRFDWLRWALRPLACLAPALGLAWLVSGCTAPWGTLVQIGAGGAAGALAYLVFMWPGALKPALCGMRSGRQKTSPANF